MRTLLASSADRIGRTKQSPQNVFVAPPNEFSGDPQHDQRDSEALLYSQGDFGKWEPKHTVEDPGSHLSEGRQ